MRKLSYSGAVSLDGYITGPDEAVDWILWSEDASAIMAEQWKGVDTMLLGRRMLELIQRGGGGGASKIRTYVFSRTLETVPKGMELACGDVAGQVDELAFSIHPVLLGGGTPTFCPDGGADRGRAGRTPRDRQRGCVRPLSPSLLSLSWRTAACQPIFASKASTIEDCRSRPSFPSPHAPPSPPPTCHKHHFNPRARGIMCSSAFASRLRQRG